MGRREVFGSSMSTFEELCRQKNVPRQTNLKLWMSKVDPEALFWPCLRCRESLEEWRKSLATPIMAEKSMLDMTEEELTAHQQRVVDRANETREDRALLVLERTQEGRLERQALKAPLRLKRRRSRGLGAAGA